MSQGEELLNTLSEEDIALYSADPSTEEHIVVGADRFITVPASLQRLAVQYDHNVETVTFDCPRYWDGLDMSKLVVVINYIRPDGQTGSYPATNIRVDETDTNIMHFDWTIDWHVTEAFGNLTFLVCIRKSDEEGNDINHWNSELNTTTRISKGLDCEGTVADRYPSLITQLLTRLGTVESKVGTVESKVDGHSNDIYALQIKDAFIDSEIAQIDEMYTELEGRVSTIEENGVPGGGGSGGPVVQSNYEQNDSTAADYIQNRPFYDTGEVEVHDITLLDGVNTNDLGDTASFPTFGFVDSNLSDKHTVTVTYGGVSKEFPVMYDANTSGFIGNNVPYHYIGDNQIALNNGTQASATYGFAITKFIENPEYIGGSAATGNVIAAVTNIQSLCVLFGLDVANAGTYTMSARQYYEEHVGLKKIDPKYLPDEVTAVSLDLSTYDSGTITETLSDGSKVTYTVTFDENGNPVNINNGTDDFAIVWGDMPTVLEEIENGTY